MTNPDDVDALMDLVREHYDEDDEAAAARAEAGRAPRAVDPAEPGLPPTQRLDQALARTPEGGVMRGKLVAAPTSVDLRRGQTPPRRAFREAGVDVPDSPVVQRAPRWARQEVEYDHAVALLEQCERRVGQTNPTKPNLPVARGKSPAPAQQHPGDVFEGSTPPSPEVTHPGFEYEPGESAFEQYAAGAEVVSGEGADFVDPEATQTMVRLGRRSST